MSFAKVCSVDDLWEGDMTSYVVEDVEVLIAWPLNGEITAFQGMCPHQDIPLAEGKFDGKVIMCRAHQWTFDACSGEGLNPNDCKLAKYPIRVELNEVWVDTDVDVFYAHS
jgi:toluene monooxygenase system ferredoxin subunit